MLLKVTHQTDLTYSDMISESVIELRMAPRQEGDQHRLSFALAVGPSAAVTGYFDWLGNMVHAFSVNPFHNQIRIIATSIVETSPRLVRPESFMDKWPLSEDAYDYSVYDYLQFGGPIQDSASLRELTRVLEPSEGLPLGEIALRMLHLIRQRFLYKKGVTNAATSLSEVLDLGQGVCQDFTHLMIGMARALRIPARYVSGFVHGVGHRYLGNTQTHAWCELMFPSAGWVGFDPTNCCAIGEDFVKVAVGRDYRDVTPNRGVYRGKAKESIDVRVSSERLGNIPEQLAAERIEPLAIPVYPNGLPAERAVVVHQQEMQQQQDGRKLHQQQQQQQ